MFIEHEATLSWADGNIRFRPAHRLDNEDYQAVTKAGFRWKRGEQAFMASWSPEREDFLREKFEIEELTDDDTDLTATAEARAEHYERFAGNAAKRSQSAFGTAREISSWIPMGQPILVGHHSEKRHRRDAARIDNNMRKGVEESRRAEYWQQRANAALARAERRERPDAIYRRIERLEADERGFQRTLQTLEKADGFEETTLAALPRVMQRYQRWLEFVGNRLAYERALYEASGGIAVEKKGLPLEKGGAVTDGRTWWPVVRVNKKSVTITDWLGIEGFEYRLTLDSIKHALTKTEWEAADKRRTVTGWRVVQEAGREQVS